MSHLEMESCMHININYNLYFSLKKYRFRCYILIKYIFYLFTACDRTVQWNLYYCIFYLKVHFIRNILVCSLSIHTNVISSCLSVFYAKLILMKIGMEIVWILRKDMNYFLQKSAPNVVFLSIYITTRPKSI